MPFTAKGSSVTKLPTGQFQVIVDYYDDDRPAKPILREQYVVVDKPALLVRVATQLQQLKQAADDAVTNMAIVGKTLGII